MTTMTAATFHFPNPPGEVSHLLIESGKKKTSSIWKEEDIKQMIYVRRVSLRGNPHMRVLIVSADDIIPLPPEFELRHLPEEQIETTVQDFQEEIAHERNGTECS